MFPWSRGVRIAMASAIWLALAGQIVLGQAASPQQTTSAPQPAPAPVPSKSDVKLVVECVLDERDDCTGNTTIDLRHRFKLRVTNLAEWTAQGNSPWNLILFISGRPFPRLHPISVDSQKNELTFKLKRTSDTAATWNDLTGRRNNWQSKGILQEVRPSVGPVGGTAYQTNAGCELVFLSWMWLSVCVGFAVLTVATLIVLFRKTALIRNGTAGPYSLARTQLAVWTWLIINGYFALFVMTWDPAVDIPASVMGLLGISAGTTLAAGLVDQASPGTQGALSKGLWKDLTGGSAVSLYRIQLVAWTAVLVFVFIAQVLSKWTIPDFNPALLGLLGLSSGTYVGFKFSENQKAVVQSAGRFSNRLS